MVISTAGFDIVLLTIDSEYLLGSSLVLAEFTAVFMSVDQSRDVACNVPTVHATSLQGFGYGYVVHQFKKRCKHEKMVGDDD